MEPRLVFWEINQKCNLRCPYCRREGYSEMGLPLEDAVTVVDSIAEWYQPLLVFSGGEPLIYPHIFEVASYARKKGLTTALASNGTLIDEAIVRKIKSVDFHRVAVSLDDAREEVNDSLRGKGTFAKAIKGIRLLKAYGVSVQINSTILKRNFKQGFAIYQLCLELGIDALHLFAFVPVGCGTDMPKEEKMSQGEYEEFLEEMAGLSLKSEIEIKLTCAPHFHRILFKKQPDYFRKRALGKGCLAGSGVCFISARGDIYPCGYLPVSAGNIFKEAFKNIWESSHIFNTLRNTDSLKGRCGSCEYVDICGGCRARAFNATGDYLEEEPDCIYQPLNVSS